jgi:long-subunit acyl-CoA synthetase (AMP-forming)
MKGYWRKPEQSAEVILTCGWLRTGEGGSFHADGFLYLHDRLKDMTGHPDVAEVAVVGVARPALASPVPCPGPRPASGRSRPSRPA